MRPFRRLRITESWLTDRLHNSGSAMSANTLAGLNPSGLNPSQQMSALLTSSLATNYNQAEIVLFYDATSKFVLHGGYRYVWGDASDAVLPAAGLVSSDEARLRRNVGLGGMTFRPSAKLSLKAEAEVGSSGGAYFRTSLYDYEKVRAQARYQALKTLNFAADFMALINNNPVPSLSYAFRTQQESLSMFWSPGKSPGKFFDLEGTYTRSTVYSDIGYRDPGDLEAKTSLYRDDAHIATALLNIKLPGKAARGGARITAGGSLFSLLGQPAHQLLSAAGKAIGTGLEKDKLVCRMALLRLWRGVRTVRRFPRESADDGAEVHARTEGYALRTTLVLSLFAAGSLHAASVAADSARGPELFTTLSCIQCHSIDGKGGTVGPDLGARIDRGFTPTTLAATMWNHAPAMWGAMRDRNIPAADFNEQGAADLFAYFYSARFFEKPGDAGTVGNAFSLGIIAPNATASPRRSGLKPRPSVSGIPSVSRSRSRPRCGTTPQQCTRVSPEEAELARAHVAGSNGYFGLSARASVRSQRGCSCGDQCWSEWPGAV